MIQFNPLFPIQQAFQCPTLEMISIMAMSRPNETVSRFHVTDPEIITVQEFGKLAVSKYSGLSK
jgi:hypothetical protein